MQVFRRQSRYHGWLKRHNQFRVQLMQRPSSDHYQETHYYRETPAQCNILRSLFRIVVHIVAEE